MTDSPRWRRGVEMFERVYAGDLTPPAPGARPYSDLMLEQLFAEVWSREELPMRERRLLVLGVLAGLGEAQAWETHARAALKNRELSPAELREVLVTLAPYAGYPRTSKLGPIAEDLISGLSGPAPGDRGIG